MQAGKGYDNISQSADKEEQSLFPCLNPFDLIPEHYRRKNEKGDQQYGGLQPITQYEE